ncbi:peptidase M15-like protein [Luteimonas cucumeris]|uniref:Peptidase M15-like protein n=1 Tax=Luteimonas cucumeris TaxID=985012 RepID=A0A562LAV1_9GAMM|nr:D-Ala-D-Ala carboxypeptidase family metallohydrolase [Luteimonas cucumeris]TWI04799.1 peptidase M15-like protein [Luteimonas cucumeris]
MALRELLMPNYVDSFNKGHEIGRENRTRKTLSQFLQPALGGDQNALSQIYGADSEAGMKVQHFAQQQQASVRDRDKDDLKQKAALYPTAPPEIQAALYGDIVSLSERLGIVPVGKAPKSLDTPESQQVFGKFIASMAGSGEPETPSSIRELQMLQANPELAELDMKRRQAGWRPNLVNVPTGDGGSVQMLHDPRTGSFQQPNFGGAVQPGPALDPTQDFPQLASSTGANPTSLFRSPDRNQAVGGVPNSQHMAGTAGDFAVPPEQRAAFIAQARQMGYEAIDEGDHVHVELPPGAQAAGRFGSGQRMGYTPPKSETKAPSEFERKLEIARGMGASEDQLRQMVLGEGGGGKPSATQIKLANTAKQKLIDLNAMDQQLANVEQAFGRLRGSLSAGLGGKYLPTEDGRRFDAAVAVLKTQVRKLTRTPGEGAMSDYESKLAELANPSRGEYEQVTDDQLQQLRSLVQTTRQGYEALLQDAGGSMGNVPTPGSNTPNSSAAGGVDDLLSKYGVK